jgi:hypothetical protein
MKKFSDFVVTVNEAESSAKSELQKSYQDYFTAKLNKFGAKSPADLSPEDKSAFFTEISKDWDRGQGAKPAGKKDVEEHGVKESAEVFEAKVKLDTTSPDEKSLLDFVKKHNIKMSATGVKIGGDFDEYEYVGKRKDLEELIKSFWGDDSLIDAIKESVNESNIKIGTFVRYKKDKDFTGGKVMSIKGDKVEISNWDGSTSELPLKDLEYVKSWNESVTNEAEVKSDEEFKEYAETVLKKAFGDEFDQEKADKTVEGILKKANGDYGAAVGMLTSGLSEGNAFAYAAQKAKDEGKEDFEFNGKTYKVNEGKMSGSGRMASYQMDNMNNGLRNDSVFITTDRFGSKNTLSIKISAYSGGADEIEMPMPKKLAELNTAVRAAMGSKDAEALKAGETADMEKSKMLQDMQAEIFDAVAKELDTLDKKVKSIVDGIVKKY